MAKKTKVEKDVEKHRKQSMTKKALKEYHKKQRDRGALFNVGTRTFKSPKDYDRKKAKEEARRAKHEATEKE